MTLRGASGMVTVGYAYDLSRLGGGAAGERKHVKQPPRAEQRVNPGLLHLSQHGNALGRIFLGENRNLGIGEKATCHQFLCNQVLRRRVVSPATCTEPTKFKEMLPVLSTLTS